MDSLTEKEFARIAKAYKTYYPGNENVLATKESISLWYEELKDIPYYVLSTALRKHVQTDKFPPVIADLRRLSQEILSPVRDWSNGWAITMKAIRHYGNYNAREGLESIKEQDDLAYQVVKRMGFVDLCNSTNNQSDRANFRSIYTELAQREKQEGVISEQLQEVIGKLNGTQKELSNGETV